MFIIDTALEKREAAGKPIRIGLIGAGYMGKGIAIELLTPLTGMRLVAIFSRKPSDAQAAYQSAGIDSAQIVTSAPQLEQAIARGRPVFTEDPMLLCEAESIDAIIEATGEVEFGARVTLRALERGKHVILMNAELDATVGPILKVRADKAGVVITNTDGDEPGVAMNLFRFAKTIGYKPVLAGNLKGMIDPYRTPDTQKAFAAKYNQQPAMITSFADGTKLSMEATILANATGLRVAKRGMRGHKCAHVKDVLNLFSPDDLLEGGYVDYVLGAEPHTGAFVVGFNDNPVKKQYMQYFKMGDGPLYCFYTPYHLPHLQIAPTVARAALFNDATVAPVGSPVCDVITMAKKNLKAGDLLDGIGGFSCYGTIDNHVTVREANLLPMGLSHGCRLKSDITRDSPITYEHVQLPRGRIVDELRLEQNNYFEAAYTSQRSRDS